MKTSKIAGVQKAVGLALGLVLSQQQEHVGVGVEVLAQVTAPECTAPTSRQLDAAGRMWNPETSSAGGGGSGGEPVNITHCTTPAGADACGTTMNITHYLNMFDTYGDGWNGNKIAFGLDYVQHGVCTEYASVVMGNPTGFQLHAVTSFQVGICAPNGLNVTECGNDLFYWAASGSWQSEISFTITAADDTTDTNICTTPIGPGDVTSANILTGEVDCGMPGSNVDSCCTTPNGEVVLTDKTLELGAADSSGWYSYIAGVEQPRHVLTLPDSMCSSSKDGGLPANTDGGYSDQDGHCSGGDNAGATGAQCTSFTMEFSSPTGTSPSATNQYPIGGSSYIMGAGSGMPTVTYTATDSEQYAADSYTYTMLDASGNILAKTSADCGKFLKCVDTFDSGCPLCPCTEPTHTVHMYDSVGDGWDPLVVPLTMEYGYPWDAYAEYYGGTNSNPYSSSLAHYVQGAADGWTVDNGRYAAWIPMQLSFFPFVESCAAYGGGIYEPWVPINFASQYTWDTVYQYAYSTRGIPTSDGYHKAMDMCFNETALNEMGYGHTIGLALGGVNRSQNTFELVNNASGILLCGGNGLCGQCRLGMLNMTECPGQDTQEYCMVDSDPFYAPTGTHKLTLTTTDSMASRNVEVIMSRSKGCYAGMQGTELAMGIESNATDLLNPVPVSKTQLLGITPASIASTTTSLTSIRYPMLVGDDTFTFQIEDESTGEIVCVGRGDCGECIPGNLNASYCSIPSCDYCEENDNGDMECDTVRANQEITVGLSDGNIVQLWQNGENYGWCTGPDPNGGTNVDICDPTMKHPNLEIHHGCYVNASGQSDTLVTARYRPDTPGFTNGLIEYNNSNIKDCVKGNWNMPAPNTYNYDNRCGLIAYYAYVDPFKTHCNKGGTPTNMMSSTGGFEEDDETFWRRDRTMQWGIKDATGQHLCFHKGKYAYDHEGWSGQDDWACESSTDSWRHCACFYNEEFNDGDDMEENPIGNPFRYCPPGTDEDDEDTWDACFDHVPMCTYGTDPSNHIGYCKEATNEDGLCSQFTTTTTTPAYVPTTAAPATTVDPSSQLDLTYEEEEEEDDDDDKTTLDPELAELLGDSVNGTDEDESGSGDAADSSSRKSFFGLATSTTFLVVFFASCVKH